MTPSIRSTLFVAALMASWACSESPRTGLNAVDAGDDADASRVDAGGDAGPGDGASGNRAPRFTSDEATEVAENTVAVYGATAVDPEGDLITYGLGGPDAAQFEIDPSSGAISAVEVLDFEAPADVDRDNSYELRVTASDDGGRASALDVSVRVLNRDLPSVEILHPPRHALLGVRARDRPIRVVVRVSDSEDGDPEGIVVTVGDDDATPLGGDPSLRAGRTTLDPVDRITVTAQGDGPAQAQVSRALVDEPAVSVGLRRPDPRWNADQVLTLDPTQMIVAQWTDDGPEVFADLRSGTGPDLVAPTAFTVGDSSDELFVADGYTSSIVRVDRETGARTLVSSPSRGLGLPFGDAFDLEWDPGGQRLILGASYRTSADLLVLGVDRATGDRTLLGTTRRPSIPLGTFTDLKVDRSGDLAWGVDVLRADGATRIIEFDLAAGQLARSVLVDEAVAAPTELRTITHVDVVDGVSWFTTVDAQTVPVSGGRSVPAGFDGDLLRFDPSAGVAALGRQFDLPIGLAVKPDQSEQLVVTDRNGFPTLVAHRFGGGSRLVGASDVGRGDVHLEQPSGVAIDPRRARAYVVSNRLAPDGPRAVVVRVDLENGRRVPVSSDVVGSGPALRELVEIVVGSDPGDAYVADAFEPAVLEIDLASGARRRVDASGPELARPVDLVLSSDEQRLFVLTVDDQTFESEVVAVDPATGARSLIAGAGRGAGPDLGSLAALSVGPDPSELLAFTQSVVDGVQRVLTIDLATGDRSELASASFEGVGFFADAVYDSARARLLVLRRSFEFPEDLVTTLRFPVITSQVYAFDLATGAFTPIGSTTRGPSLAAGSGLALNADLDLAFISDGQTGLQVLDLVTGERLQVSH